MLTEDYPPILTLMWQNILKLSIAEDIEDKNDL